MSRTTLCVLTAAVLGTLSLGTMLFRHHVLGSEVSEPTGPGTWKVTMLVKGRTQLDARLTTATPLNVGHQRIVREAFRSAQLAEKLPDQHQLDRHPERRLIYWVARGGSTAGEFRAVYEFTCTTDEHRPTAEMNRLARVLKAPPQPGEYLDAETPRGAELDRLFEVAREETSDRERPLDQVEALFRYVDQKIADEPSSHTGAGSSAAECLEAGGGDARAKSRLLVALLRSRGVPARVVTGLKLTRGQGQLAHYWVEAWVQDHWMSLCPFYHHYARLPSNYLVFGYGDGPVVRGRHMPDLDYSFLVDRSVAADALAATELTPLRRTLRSLSLYTLPPAEQRLVEFLLLMPLAALIICVFRNLIGLHTFGTFAPALVGLAFRDIHSLPGILVFVSIILIGWLMRRALDYYHLLQTPRVAVLLSLVVMVLICAIVFANFENYEASRYIPLFPMVILTGMIERFWTLETEDSATASFKTLLSTIGLATAIALVVGQPAVVNHLFCYPETLGLILAIQLLIGRYTGYRLSELFRFRDFIQPRPELRLVQED